MRGRHQTISISLAQGLALQHCRHLLKEFRHQQAESCCSQLLAAADTCCGLSDGSQASETGARSTLTILGRRALVSFCSLPAAHLLACQLRSPAWSASSDYTLAGFQCLHCARGCAYDRRAMNGPAKADIARLLTFTQLPDDVVKHILSMLADSMRCAACRAPGTPIPAVCITFST